MSARTYLLAAFVLMACGVEQTAPGGEHQSAIPALTYGAAGDDLCPVPLDERRSHEPHLGAWLSVADSVFVGTVSRIEVVSAPAFLLGWDYTLDEPEYTMLTSLADCPNQGGLMPAIRMHFTDVKTLHGEALPDGFSIQMGRNTASEYPGVRSTSDGSSLTSVEDQDVYFVGSRVGAAVFKDVDGKYHWRYRQFEVLGDDTIRLQEVREEDPPDCWDQPLVTSIPDAYDGVTLTEFEQAMAQAPTSLPAPIALAVETRHSAFADDMRNPRYLTHQNATCWPEDDDDGGGGTNNRDTGQ